MSWRSEPLFSRCVLGWRFGGQDVFDVLVEDELHQRHVGRDGLALELSPFALRNVQIRP
jgi:hypothetical protein